MSVIYGNVIGGGSASLKTLMIVDENNNEYVGVVVDEEVIFTATAEDIKLGKIAASDSGIVVGTHICE